MKMKQNVIALGAALILGLTGCGGQTQVNVEQAGMLATAAASSDKFAGVVVSENAVVSPGIPRSRLTSCMLPWATPSGSTKSSSNMIPTR